MDNLVDLAKARRASLRSEPESTEDFVEGPEAERFVTRARSTLPNLPFFIPPEPVVKREGAGAWVELYLWIPKE